MRCEHCNSRVNDTAEFCTTCGAPVPGAFATPRPPAFPLDHHNAYGYSPPPAASMPPGYAAQASAQPNRWQQPEAAPFSHDTSYPSQGMPYQQPGAPNYTQPGGANQPQATPHYMQPQPESPYTQPAAAYRQPAAAHQQPGASYHQPGGAHQPQDAGAPYYHQPGASYQQPGTSYQQPTAPYMQPQPVASYQQPATAYHQQGAPYYPQAGAHQFQPVPPKKKGLVARIVVICAVVVLICFVGVVALNVSGAFSGTTSQNTQNTTLPTTDSRLVLIENEQITIVFTGASQPYGNGTDYGINILNKTHSKVWLVFENVQINSVRDPHAKIDGADIFSGTIHDGYLYLETTNELSELVISGTIKIYDAGSLRLLESYPISYSYGK